MDGLLHPRLCVVPYVAQTLRDALRGQPYLRRTLTFLICYIWTEQQVLQQHAIAIADTYTVNRDLWQKAAADLRQPYWDWASNSVPPAEVISLQQVNITKPDGSRGSVQNPLFSYRFHPIDGSFPAPFSRWNSTLRQPVGTAAGATSNVSRLTRYFALLRFHALDTNHTLSRVLQNAQMDIKTSTYNLLSRVNTWPGTCLSSSVTNCVVIISLSTSSLQQPQCRRRR
jgi:hypothetical protein